MTDVFHRFDEAQADWRDLWASAPASPYQAYPFLSAWFETVGKARALTPLLVVDRGPDGRASALLPLCAARRSGLSIGLFLGGSESNLCLPLVAPQAHYDAARLRALLVEAAVRAPEPVDLFCLRNQPRRFEGVDNPLAFANARPSASSAYGAILPASMEELAAKISKESRKKARKKEARLAAIGALSYEHRARGQRGDEILAALRRQKSARFAGKGVSADLNGEALPDFLSRLSRESGDGALELHALSVGGRIVATYAGVVARGRFSAMLNSYEMEPEIARCSPGELLLHALLRNLVARGVTRFDLGAGEARYKNAVCDETIDLCDLVLPVTARGRALAPLLSGYLRLKRFVKQTPTLANAYYRVTARRAPA
jgi:CelD/BcsL family acetyltransferase involved in cellulose biosynthesis